MSLSGTACGVGTIMPGRGAPVSFAIAAVDTALWDLKGRALGQPLWQLLGESDPRVKVYARQYRSEFGRTTELLEDASKSIEAGHRSVKMRLGKPTLAEDLARVAAMRKHIGDDIELMTDANEAWRIDKAIRATQRLAEFDPVWLEEPMQPDDFAATPIFDKRARCHWQQEKTCAFWRSSGS